MFQATDGRERAPGREDGRRPHVTAGFTALMILAILLPFELKNPVFSIGPLGITDVEIALYAVVALWGAARLSGRCRGWTAAHSAVAAFAGVFVLTAALAPVHRAEALKFALRVAGGCALCLAQADFARTPGRAAAVFVALVAGSFVSAGAAAAEIRLPGASALLSSFKTAPALSGSYLRAGGTFQYPNIASMYWEATVPLALAASAWLAAARSGKRWLWAGVLPALVLFEAILLSASRAGIILAPLSVAGLLWFALRRGGLARAGPALALGSMALLLVIHVFAGGLLPLRMTTRDLSDWYRAHFSGFPASMTLTAGQTVRIPLTIRNEGRIAWRAGSDQAIELSYHWLDEDAKNVLIWQGAVSELPGDVEPGAAAAVKPWVRAPFRPGRYTLQWDMVQRRVAWFSTFGSGGAFMKVHVAPSVFQPIMPADPPQASLPLSAPAARPDLWRAAVRLWLQRPVFGVGPDNFRRLYGSSVGTKNYDERIYANNLYLETLADTGIIGFLSLAAVVTATAALLRRAWKLRDGAPERTLLAGAAIGLAAFYVHGLVDYFQAFTPTYALFWMLTGALIGMGQGDPQ